MAHTKRLIILLVLALLLAGGVMWRVARIRGSKGALSVEQLQALQGLPVRVYEVQPQSIRETIAISGGLEAVQEVAVAPKVSERIAKLHVDIGDRVRQGDVLVSLDDTVSRLRVGQAEASLAEAEAQLEKLRNGSRPEEIAAAEAAWEESKAAVTIGEIEWQRQKGLYEEDATTLKSLQFAENDYLRSKAAAAAAEANYELVKDGPRDEEIAMAVAQAELARVALAQARQNLTDHTLAAPCAGVVTRNLREEGDLVEVNEMVFRVLDSREMHLTIDVSELYLPHITVGMTVEVSVDALPEREFVGTVATIDPGANPSERSYQTEILVDNATGVLQAGMFARAHIVVRELTDVLLIPKDGLRSRDGEDYVLMINGKASALAEPLTEYDFVDLPGLAQRLTAGSDPVAQHLGTLLSDKLRNTLQGEWTDELREPLLAELNEVIAAGSLYEAQRFAGVDLGLIESEDTDEKDDAITALRTPMTLADVERVTAQLNQPAANDKKLQKLAAAMAEDNSAHESASLEKLQAELETVLAERTQRRRQAMVLNRWLLEKAFAAQMHQSQSAVKRSVRVGETFGSQVEILEGLAVDDRVVTLAQGSLQAGAKVTVIGKAEPRMDTDGH